MKPNEVTCYPNRSPLRTTAGCSGMNDPRSHGVGSRGPYPLMALQTATTTNVS